MASFEFSKMPDSFNAVKASVSDAIRSIGEISNAYASMREEVEQSVNESRQAIDANKSNIQTANGAQLDQVLARCREYGAYIKELNDDARNKSKAYQKACAESEQTPIQQPQHSIETLDQCQGKLYELSEKAKEAYESIINTNGINGLMSAVSGEAKKNQVQLISAYKSSRDLMRRAEGLAAERRRRETDIAQSNANAQIESAEEEGRILFDQISERENGDISKSLASLSYQFEKIISSAIIASLTDLDPLIRPEAGARPKGQCQQLRLGNYICKVNGWPFVGHLAGIDEVLSEHFGKWYKDGHIDAPAIIDRATTSSVIICGNISSACHTLNWLSASELETNQAPSQTFTFINPSGDREVFEPFLAAIKECKEVFGEGILTDDKSINEAFNKALSAINDRSQRLLIGYRDIYEFNEDEDTAELPLITICMATRFGALTKQNIEDIKSIVRNGSFCGVNIFLAIDPGDTSVEEVTEFLTGCSRAFIAWDKGTAGVIELDQDVDIVFDPISWKRIGDDIPVIQEDVQNQLAQSIGIEAVLPKSQWFEGSSLDGLAIPMGKAPDGKRLDLEFGPKVSNGISHFGLMIGATGSGKSTLLHSLILSSLLKYGPDELRLYLLDFKSGVEFEIYSKYRIPQLKLLALDAMQAFGLSILTELRHKMDERNRLFKSEGIQNIEEYRQVTGNAMPRILVLMDEFQTLFNEDHDKRAARESAILLADFISLARNCGIHFLLSTQTFSRLRTGNFSVSQSTLDEMHVRIGLQCSLNEAERLFGDIYGKQAYELMGTQKGCGVYTENDLKLPPEAFRSVFCDKEEREELLKAIEKHYSAINFTDAALVFRSDTVPTLRVETLREAGRNDDQDKGVQIYLGEPIKIAEPVAISVNRRLRSTLLIAGADGNLMCSLIADYMFSALAARDNAKQLNPEMGESLLPVIYLCDGREIVGDKPEDSMSRVYSGRYEDVKRASRNIEAIQFIDELYELMIKRQSAANGEFNTVHFIVSEFQWIDAFLAVYERRDHQYDSDIEHQSASTSDSNAILDSILNDISNQNAKTNLSRLEKLEQLIQRGYVYGINVVIGTSDFASLRERLYDLVPNMQNRIVFSLSEDDSERLVHGSLGLIDTLRSNMAIYSDGRTDPVIFKPYRIAEV